MKRALVTSGGGAKGAFSVGALQVLFENGINQFDIISGTSTGSLIAVFAAVQDLETLFKEYTQTKTVDILKPQNLVEVLLRKNFIYDTLPLQKKIAERVTDELAKKVLALDTTICLTAIGLKSGRITVFTTKALGADTEEFDEVLIDSPEMLRNAMLASSSQAAFLKPVPLTVNIKGREVKDVFVDGGNRDVLPTRVPVMLGCDEIFVLSNNPKELFQQQEVEIENLFDVLTRAIAIFIQEIRSSNYRRIVDHDIRSINMQPETELDFQYTTGLRFDEDLMISWLSEGRDVAKKALQHFDMLSKSPDAIS